MARRNLFVGFGAGVLAGGVATIILMGGRTSPRAMAQDVQPPRILVPAREPAPNVPPPAPAPAGEPAPALVPPPQAQPIPAEAVPPPPPAATQRYQISAWAQSGTVGPGGGPGGSHGAYVIDTQSGEVWQIDGQQRPGKISRVGKVGPE
jgi:hypothetical protein